MAERCPGLDDLTHCPWTTLTAVGSSKVRRVQCPSSGRPYPPVPQHSSSATFILQDVQHIGIPPRACAYIAVCDAHESRNHILFSPLRHRYVLQQLTIFNSLYWLCCFRRLVWHTSQSLLESRRSWTLESPHEVWQYVQAFQTLCVP